MKTKNLFISLILLFFFISTVNAQNSPLANRAKADSLKQLIDAYNKEDEEKVRLLNDYARQCFYNLDIKNGLTATRNARLLSEKLNFEGGKVMYYLTLATFFGDGNMFEYYLKQAQWLTNNPDKQLRKYYINLQKVEHNIGSNYDSLLNEFTILNDHFEKIGDKEIQACLSYSIAGFYYLMGNIEEEINAENRIIKLYTDLEQIYPVFLCSTFIMGNLRELGKEDEAKKLEIELIDFIAKNRDSNAIGLICLSMGAGYSQSGRNALAIEYYFISIPTFERANDLNMLAETYLQMGRSYDVMEMFDKAVDSYHKYINLLKKENDHKSLFGAYNRIAMALYHNKSIEDARKYLTLALQDTSAQNKILFQGRKYSMKGQILKDSLQFAEAIPYFQSAYKNYHMVDQRSSIPFMSMYMAECYLQMKDYNTALDYALKSLKEENEINLSRTKVKRDLSLLLSEIYDALGQQQQAFEYLKMYQKIRSESDQLDEANRIADAEIRIILEKSQAEIEILEQQKAQKEQESKIQRLWIFSIAGALLSVLFLTLILFRNNKTKQKANAKLKLQKEEIEETLAQLKSTQSQLIQSEKMASLGELTAGIAHEIQNPLNFVNNFSEVSKELIVEMNEELEKGDLNEAKEIGKDIDNNLEKINHHGKRAEAIVKGMLQHSRTSSGEKESTDINALADEYLRLSYHGLRAKDKSFNADFKMEFDETLPKINVIPQDIGRVLLNLINNAFYAVNKRAKDFTPQPSEGGAKNAQTEYHPTIIVSTTSSKSPSELVPNNREDLGVKISVKDNGSGIPQNIVDKIFQPFFTTKPTGSGTGLGLSLSYDIVKAHGGEISVESKEGEGTEFIIQIPTN